MTDSDELVGEPEAFKEAEEPAVVHAVEGGAEVDVCGEYILSLKFGVFKGGYVGALTVIDVPKRAEAVLHVF